MALERLQSIFNKIEDNTQDLEDGIPVESISNSLYDDFHSFGTQGNHKELINIPDISKKQNPSPLVAINGIFAEDGTITPINPVNGHNFRQIRINDNAGTNLLQTVGVEYSGDKGFGEVVVNKNNEVLNFTAEYNLGKGKFVLESLFDKTHGNSTPDRIPFGEPGKLSSDLLLHTAGKDVGSTANLNIRENQGYGGRGNEPYVVKPIGAVGRNEKASGYDREFLPYNAAKDDIVRLFKYYVTRKGLGSILKENLTNLAVGDGFTLSEPFRSIMLPALPVPMTGLLNNYQQKFQSRLPSLELYKKAVDPVTGEVIQGDTIFKYNGTAFGGSVRKPARIDYSLGVKIATPFTLKPLGDMAAIPFDVSPLDKYYGTVRETKRKEYGDAFYKDDPILGDASTKTKVVGTAKNAGRGLYNLGQKSLTLLDKARVKIQNALVDELKEQASKLTQLPPIDQPVKRFHDLSGGGKNTTYVDEFSLSRTIEPFDYTDGDSELDIDRGDFYVRIRDMRNSHYLYFRGYVTGITENLTPTWNPTTYIGRSEDVWIYQKGERDISFNLKVAPQNVEEFDAMYEKMNSLTSLVYPAYSGTNRMIPPFTELYMAHIGSKAKGQFGYIKSLTYTVNEQGDWDALSQRPRVFDIALSYQILHRKPPQIYDTFYGATVDE